MCKLARFYGWNPQIIENLDADMLETYWQGITVLEAQDAMMAARIVSYPWAKKEDQRKFYRDMRRLSSLEGSSGDMSTTSIAEKLRAAINGK